jgi:elongation factor 3
LFAAQLSQLSRVVVVGANGAGKTTLMKVMVGEALAMPGVGEMHRHHNLRLAYIAQHSMHHVEDHLERSPLEYLQYRFYEGRDRELAKMVCLAFTEEDKVMMAKPGQVCEIVSRVERSKELWYQIKKCGMKDSAMWRALKELKTDVNPPHVMKLVHNYDELLKAEASGMDIRPTTSEEMLKHLDDFSIDKYLARQKIKGFSGGQKSRLVLAAAMWSKPHLIALDEPTNYLDNETLAALTKALRSFKGGVIAISHHEAFVAALCTEKWVIREGKLAETIKLADSKSKLKEFKSA